MRELVDVRPLPLHLPALPLHGSPGADLGQQAQHLELPHAVHQPLPALPQLELENLVADLATVAQGQPLSIEEMVEQPELVVVDYAHQHHLVGAVLQPRRQGAEIFCHGGS